MILTAGLTPAWQQVLTFNAFRYGEVNRAADVSWLAQGKVINVGIGVHGLGGPSLTLAPLGGPAVVPIDRELEQLGVPRRWIITAASTRVCTTILDRGAGVTTELIENGKALQTQELAEFLRAYAEEAGKARMTIITGSLPTGTPHTFYRDLVAHTPCPTILDFRGAGLLATLDLKPLVVKPNREELAQTISQPLADDQQLVAAMRSLNDRGAQWVVSTQGTGPVWATTATKIYRLQPLLAEHVVNPIGSGDAMTAGMAWALRNGQNMLDALRCGIAAAAENVRQLETCRLAPDRVQQQARLVHVETLA